jgi:hypothetical protein
MQLVQHIQDFRAWSMEDIQLDRGRYVAPVQTSTIDKQEECILAYMGYLEKYWDVDVTAMSLYQYQDLHSFADYISYILARGAGKGHAVKHISLAKKINAFLKAEQQDGAWEAQADAVDSWLAQLETQLGSVLPDPTKRETPTMDELISWVEELGNFAELEVHNDREFEGEITKATARLVQQTIIAMLVVGVCAPPIRLSIIKSAVHPDYAKECMDPDCRRGPDCLGNVFKLIDGKQAMHGYQVIRGVFNHEHVMYYCPTLWACHVLLSYVPSLDPSSHHLPTVQLKMMMRQLRKGPKYNSRPPTIRT